MYVTQNKLIAATITAALSLSTTGALRAADAPPVLTMKPLQGVSFDIGTKHSVSYFLNDSGQCKLVLTLADDPSWGDVPSFTAIRFEAAIPPGKTTRYNSGEGDAVEFACQADAQTMSVKPVQDIATNARR